MANTPQPDLSEFLKLSKPKSPPCRVATAIEALTQAQREQIAAALKTDQGVITNAAISQWLSGHGHDLHAAAVTSHRKGNCKCGRNG